MVFMIQSSMNRIAVPIRAIRIIVEVLHAELAILLVIMI